MLIALVAQLDRALASGAKGCGFDPRRAQDQIPLLPSPHYVGSADCPRFQTSGESTFVSAFGIQTIKDGKNSHESSPILFRNIGGLSEGWFSSFFASRNAR